MPTILVCDDDRVISHLISSRLMKAGAQVQIAYDAMQAMMMTVRIIPDAVVLDLSMPGGNGLDVLRRLKASPRTSQVPVLVISGTVHPEQKAEAARCGAARFFPKPPNMDNVVRCLEELGVLPLRARV
jgi:DNA-binding response OmpR family regulator